MNSVPNCTYLLYLIIINWSHGYIIVNYSYYNKYVLYTLYIEQSNHKTYTRFLCYTIQ